MKHIYMILVFCFLGNILFSQDGNTPTNLQIDAASVVGVTLSWDVPANFTKEWITHSNYIFGAFDNYNYNFGAVDKFYL